MKGLSYVIVIFIVTLFQSCTGIKEKKNAKLFGGISNGMRVPEVENILGKPDTIIVSFDSTIYFFYFTNNQSLSRNTQPVVVFNKTGEVIFSSSGNGP